MSKFDELVETYKAEFKKLGVKYDEELLIKVTKGCGPSIYNRDASTVAGTDEKELETVKKNFLIKKLGLSEKDDLDGAIKSVIEKFGSSNRNKYRAMFYYMLVEKFGKQSVYK
jgi:hypothetical protein